MKNVFDNAIFSNQNFCVNGKFITKGRRLVSNILEIADYLNIKIFLVSVSIQKVSDFLSHKLLLTVLEKYGFHSA